MVHGLFPGQMLGHYRLLSEIGHGGMGRVFLAEDTRLGRQIALKVLSDQFVADPERLRRFETEARAAAALNHPNIVTLHSVEEAGGRRFITMELVRGRPLRRLIEPHGVPLQHLIDLAVQIARAITAAHAAGIAHRDLKPDNVMVLDSGTVKVLDFGLAKFAADPVRESGSDAVTQTRPHETTAGAMVGTVAYMSPEQALGHAVDLRSTLFSFGVVLFEMATGKRPFQGPGAIALLSAIVKDTPPALREADPSLPAELNDLVRECLAKDPAERPASAADVAGRLEKLRGRVRSGPTRNRGLQIVIGGGALLIVTAIGALIGFQQRGQPHWNDERALARIEQLIDDGRPAQAFDLARQAPDAARVPQRLWSRMSASVTLRTDPADASVSIRGWDDTESRWTSIGRTPLEGVRLASVVHLLRLEKPGRPPLDLAYDGRPAELTLRLVPDAAMAHVPGGRVNLRYVPGLFASEPVEITDFLIGRKEVTNEEYLAFVEAGGYERPEYWTEPFVDEGRELSFEEAMRRFVDSTGRPGPSTWRLGRHPEGLADHPVAGLSWFEAAAYAKYAGKQLPTIFHWFRASGRNMAQALVPAANFGGNGPRPVDASLRPGAYGLYDTAGNVREWCRNASGAGRYILGGGWNDPSYMFLVFDHRSPFDRTASNGMRYVDYSPARGPSPQTAAALVPRVRDIAAVEPVPDKEFERIVHSYDYSPVELDPTAEVVGESPSWRRERVEYSAGYDDERMFGWLFLPKSSRPPYQIVILVPGGNAFDVPSSARVEDLVGWDGVDFIVEDGRAVLCPVFKNTYERRTSKNATRFDPLEWRDAYARWSREMRQSVRYLKTRSDIDVDRLAYYGSSWGASAAPGFLVLEPRFRAAVLQNGGLWLGEDMLPEYDGVHFAPRVRVPVLMLNGRYDSIFPLESAQRVLFERLGSPTGAKRHVVFDVGHDFPPRNEMIRETLDWLDTYLGKVR